MKKIDKTLREWQDDAEKTAEFWETQPEFDNTRNQKELAYNTNEKAAYFRGKLTAYREVRQMM